MKTLMMFCFAAFATTAVLVSRARTDEVPSNDPFFLDDSEVSDDAVELQPARDELEALRDQYLDAARQRSELMDEESLRQAIAGEEKTIAELHAQKSLDQVEQQLLRITNEFPATAAGQRAAALLQQMSMLKQKSLHQGDSSMFIEATPDDFFERESGGVPDPVPMFARDPQRRSRNAAPDDDLILPKNSSIPNIIKPRNGGAFFNTPESNINRKSSDPDKRQ